MTSQNSGSSAGNQDGDTSTNQEYSGVVSTQLPLLLCPSILTCYLHALSLGLQFSVRFPAVTMLCEFRRRHLGNMEVARG